MKYGSHKWGADVHWGETVSAFSKESANSMTFHVEGGFGDGDFGMGVFGAGQYGAETVTFTKDIPTTVTYNG